jgi:hypothetical protein
MPAQLLQKKNCWQLPMVPNTCLANGIPLKQAQLRNSGAIQCSAQIAEDIRQPFAVQVSI